MQQPKYNIYPSLLDAFAGYVNSAKIYSEYYGFAEDPSITEDEFEAQKMQDLIDKINRVPFESEAADKGTMFNEVIDCIVEKRKSDKMQMLSAPDIIEVSWKDWKHCFNLHDCKTIASAVKGAVSQDYQEGFINTKYGFVKIYGYSDFLLPFRVVDLKTTGKYFAFKFRNNWQHIVYPFLLNFNGNFINEFTYLVYKWTRNGGEIFEEEYTYDEVRDLPKLQDFVEQFIEFLEAHRDQITDQKIFNLQKETA